LLHRLIPNVDGPQRGIGIAPASLPVKDTQCLTVGGFLTPQSRTERSPGTILGAVGQGGIGSEWALLHPVIGI
jgi:hypothetical protein